MALDPVKTVIVIRLEEDGVWMWTTPRPAGPESAWTLTRTYSYDGMESGRAMLDAAGKITEMFPPVPETG